MESNEQPVFGGMFLAKSRRVFGIGHLEKEGRAAYGDDTLMREIVSVASGMAEANGPDDIEMHRVYLWELLEQVEPGVEIKGTNTTEIEKARAATTPRKRVSPSDARSAAEAAARREATRGQGGRLFGQISGRGQEEVDPQTGEPLFPVEKPRRSVGKKPGQRGYNPSLDPAEVDAANKPLPVRGRGGPKQKPEEPEYLTGGAEVSETRGREVLTMDEILGSMSRRQRGAETVTRGMTDTVAGLEAEIAQYRAAIGEVDAEAEIAAGENRQEEVDARLKEAGELREKMTAREAEVMEIRQAMSAVRDQIPEIRAKEARVKILREEMYNLEQRITANMPDAMESDPETGARLSEAVAATEAAHATVDEARASGDPDRLQAAEAALTMAQESERAAVSAYDAKNAENYDNRMKAAIAASMDDAKMHIRLYDEARITTGMTDAQTRSGKEDKPPTRPKPYVPVPQKPNESDKAYASRVARNEQSAKDAEARYQKRMAAWQKKKDEKSFKSIDSDARRLVTGLFNAKARDEFEVEDTEDFFEAQTVQQTTVPREPWHRENPKEYAISNPGLVSPKTILNRVSMIQRDEAKTYGEISDVEDDIKFDEQALAELKNEEHIKGGLFPLRAQYEREEILGYTDEDGRKIQGTLEQSKARAKALSERLKALDEAQEPLHRELRTGPERAKMRAGRAVEALDKATATLKAQGVNIGVIRPRGPDEPEDEYAARVAEALDIPGAYAMPRQLGEGQRNAFYAWQRANMEDSAARKRVREFEEIAAASNIGKESPDSGQTYKGIFSGLRKSQK